MRFRLTIAAAVLFSIALLLGKTAIALAEYQEQLPAPAPVADDSNSVLPADAPIDMSDDETAAVMRIVPAVLVHRRYGPVEEPEPEFYTLRNVNAPGFDWSAGLAGGGLWGPGWGYGYAYPGYRFGFVGYGPNYYRPWYTYPTSRVWGNRFPWYSPGGIGPNIYQPWYLWPNRLPWYSPNSPGPNIYSPWYTWQSNYPWYGPNGPGPNIYTPQWQQYNGCYYW